MYNCINCFKKGHSFRECDEPITSYGVIGISDFEEEFKIVLVQRRDTMGFIDFIRGKYNPDIKKEEILEIFVSEMTNEERNKLLLYNFDELWNQLWLNKNSRIFKNEYKTAKRKFLDINVKEMVREYSSKWEDTEFSIPKGRRNKFEREESCALREFSEESGIPLGNVSIIKEIQPISETFYGSNSVPYRHVYYFAKIKGKYIPTINYNSTSQGGEVKKIGWYSYKECMNIFRDYESTKRNVIHRAFKILNTSCIKDIFIKDCN